jgi:purine-binding chemotaxis protein CheW
MSHHTLHRPASRTAARAPSAGEVREVLAFRLDGQDDAIDIQHTQEIRSFEPPVRMPNSPAHLLGMLQLRGSNVPIVDLRLHFRLTDPVYDALTAVIVGQVQGRPLGLLGGRTLVLPDVDKLLPAASLALATATH